MSDGPAAGGGSAVRLAPAGAEPALAPALLAGALAFLAVLALALGLAAGRLAAAWGGGVLGSATLEITAPAEAVEAEARAALEVLRDTAGVRSVRVVEVEEQRALLEPWIGVEIPASSLPLVIEVATVHGRLDAAALETRLAAAAPSAVFDDHAAWREPLAAAAAGLRTFAFGCLALLALALAAALSLAARAAVAAGGPAVGTLRLVGARDGFIVRALTRRLNRAAAAGACAGAALACGLLAALPRASEAGFFLVGIGPVGWEWALAPLVPLGAAATGWAAVALAARRGLRRWS